MTTVERRLTIPACSVVVYVWSTNSAVVQGKPNDADRRALVELLRADRWTVKG